MTRVLADPARNIRSVVENKISKKKLTLTIVHQDRKVLLGMKKRGFGAGRWNGFGGKVEVGETVEEAAHRELQEESGLIAKKMFRRGIVEFEFESNQEIMQVFIYYVTEFEGEPIETGEMKPQWFEEKNIPFELMWPDDVYWMPYLLSGKNFEGKILFDRPSDAEYSSKILSMKLCEVDTK